MNDLVIANTTIRQDDEGRYCLNDLHRASGGEKRHQPSDWLRLAQTQELIDEIASVPGIPGTDTGNPVSVVRGGLQQGTYVCRELVYAYAQWVSPKFHLHVIRTFDAVVTGHKQAAGGEFSQGVFREFQFTRLELVKTVADMTEHSLRLANLLGLRDNQGRFYADKLVKRQIGIGPIELLGLPSLTAAEADLTFSPQQLGARFNMSARTFNGLLMRCGFQFKAPAGESPAWRPTPKGEPHCAYEDTGRQHNDGTPVRVLRWKESLLDELRKAATELGGLLKPVARG